MTQAQYVQSILYRENSEYYFHLLHALEGFVWLDSGKPASEYGRFDIFTALPEKVLKNPSIEELEAEFESLQSKVNQGCLDAIHQHDLPFCGGLLGYFNYEHRHSYFKISESKDTLNDYVGVFHWAIIQDHDKKQSFLIYLNCISKETLNEFKSLSKKIIKQGKESTSSVSNSIMENDFSVEDFTQDELFESYKDDFDEIQNHIAEGDCYQINYSQRFSGKFCGNPASAYLKLRKATPTPFSAYLSLNENTILSLSPERFIDIQNRKASTRPIKGTAAREKDASEDKRAAEILANSEKNRAENVMIVDLLRNDFSQSCEAHSVKVPMLFELESFANVHHLVSTIEGTLKKDVSPLEFFWRCFPGGSITGAPKKRAMEIIDKLENHNRNIYCGSIWYWSLNHRFDSNIAIRTLYVADGNIFCHGGGGIVADSTAEEEFQESVQKVAALLNAL